MRNVKNAKKKSVAVNNGHALKALAHEMWQCAAADISALKGFGDASQTRFSTVSARSGNRQKRYQGPLIHRLPSMFANYFVISSACSESIKKIFSALLANGNCFSVKISFATTVVPNLSTYAAFSLSPLMSACS